MSSKSNVLKMASLVMCAAVVGAPVIGSVGAAPDHDASAAVATTNTTSDMSNISVGNTVLVQMTGMEKPIKVEADEPFDMLVAKCLKVLGANVTDDTVYCIDFVGENRERQHIRVGSTKADSVMSVQTVGDFFGLVGKQADMSELIVLNDDGEIARIACSIGEDKSLSFESTQAVLEGKLKITTSLNGLNKPVDVVPGDEVRIGVTVTNPQDVDMTDMAFRTILPSGLEYVSASVVADEKSADERDIAEPVKPIEQDMVIDGMPVSLKAGESVSFEVVVKVKADTKVGSQVARFEVFYGENHSTVQTSKDLKINVVEKDNPEKPVEKCTLTLDTAGGSTLKPIEVETGSTISVSALPTPVRDGYKFMGWLSDGNKLGETITVDKDMTLVASWEENQVVLTFDTNGGSTVEPMSVKPGVEVKDLPVPTKEGHKFIGWATTADADASGVVTTVTPTKAMTLYAVWEKVTPDVKEFTVTFDSQGGSEVKTLTVKEGEKLSEFETPTKPGHKFLGWFTEPDNGEGGEDGKKVDSLVVVENTTLYAHWEKVSVEKPDKPDKPNTKPDTKPDGKPAEKPAEETRYTLNITTADNKKQEVSIPGSKTLQELVDALGYKATSYSIKTVDGKETKIAGDMTIKELTGFTKDGEALLIAYDADNKPLGSAKITRTDANTYAVALSKSTDVSLGKNPYDGSADKGKGEDGKGKGEGEGKGDTPAPPVHTADALPLYGGMAGLMASLSGVLAFLKKKFF